MVKLKLLVLMSVLVAAALSTSSQARSLIEKLNLSPYKECIQSCKSCACTQVWPPDLSLCVCLDPGKVKEKTVPVTYKECNQSCESACACTLVYPQELSQCICLDPSQPLLLHNLKYELSSGNHKGRQLDTVS